MDNLNDIRKKGVSFLPLPSLFKFFCDWHTETVPIERLQDRLNAIENQGGKIEHVLPSTHLAFFRVIWTKNDFPRA